MYLLYKKTSRRTSWRTSAFLIIVMKVLYSQTLCFPEEYQINGVCCLKCPPGNRVDIDCTEFRATSCLPCMNGTYMDNATERMLCYTCTNCDSGSGLKVKRSCTPTSDTVCEPLEGFFCINVTKDQCEAAQKHTVCHPGQYIKEKGSASSDTVCSDCSDGTFSDGTSCLQHTNVGGIIIGVVVPLVILIAAVLCYVYRKKIYSAVRNRNGDNSRENPQDVQEPVQESEPLQEGEAEQTV